MPLTHTHARHLHSRGHTWTLQTGNTLRYKAHRHTHPLYTNSMSAHWVHTRTGILCKHNTVLLHLKFLNSLFPLMSLPQLTRSGISSPLLVCVYFATDYCCRLPQSTSLHFTLLLVASLPSVQYCIRTIPPIYHKSTDLDHWSATSMWYKYKAFYSVEKKKTLLVNIFHVAITFSNKLAVHTFCTRDCGYTASTQMWIYETVWIWTSFCG